MVAVSDREHRKFMKAALSQAKKAYKKGEVPVGAVIVNDNKIISRSYNQKEGKMISVCHAEITAIEKACRKMKNWRLNDCCLYVTLEPCMMCMGAIIESRIQRIVYGADNFHLGFLRILKEQFPLYVKNMEIIPGIMAEESSSLLKEFFKAERWLSTAESARLEIE
ncbi:MAG: nucleoside deaminase [Candidatus Eremiobacteraeota bacterium]|nr:nucleoside deaminase [Candidatus Eremiobacteraeota bacterium]